MADLTPQAFAERWSKSTLSERSSYQQHFLDLCDMLGQPAPVEADPTGEFYTFEKGVEKTGRVVPGRRRVHPDGLSVAYLVPGR